MRRMVWFFLWFATYSGWQCAAGQLNLPLFHGNKHCEGTVSDMRNKTVTSFMVHIMICYSKNPCQVLLPCFDSFVCSFQFLIPLLRAATLTNWNVWFKRNCAYRLRVITTLQSVPMWRVFMASQATSMVRTWGPRQPVFCLRDGGVLNPMFWNAYLVTFSSATFETGTLYAIAFKGPLCKFFRD